MSIQQSLDSAVPFGLSHSEQALLRLDAMMIHYAFKAKSNSDINLWILHCQQFQPERAIQGAEDVIQSILGPDLAALWTLEVQARLTSQVNDTLR